jgi:hypothetical protein
MLFSLLFLGNRCDIAVISLIQGFRIKSRCFSVISSHNKQGGISSPSGKDAPMTVVSIFVSHVSGPGTHEADGARQSLWGLV